ncbi:MAG: globin domain-containing protein [Polyangiaceae bacterium]
MPLNAPVLRASLELVVERSPMITPRFYEILFSRYPQVKPMFSRNAAERQQKMLQDAIVAVVDHVEDATWLTDNLHAMGAKHVEYGVTDEMYGWVGECLIATLKEVAGEQWNSTIETAWVDAYGAITGLMIEGAHRPA